MVIQTLLNALDIRVFCVLANDGKHTDAVVRGGYVGLGFLAGHDLSRVDSKDAIRGLMETDYSGRDQHIGVIHRFLHEIRPGDWVLAPTGGRRSVYIGKVLSDYFYQATHDDGASPYAHRRRVKWCTMLVEREELPEGWQGGVKHCQLTVFRVGKPRVRSGHGG